MILLSVSSLFPCLLQVWVATVSYSMNETPIVCLIREERYLHVATERVV